MESFSNLPDDPVPSSSDESLIDLAAPNGVISHSVSNKPPENTSTDNLLSLTPSETNLTKWKRIKIYLSDTSSGTAIMICMSILVLALGLAVSLGPGAHTIFLREQGIVIDKSIAAFSIPSHEAIKRYDALKLAINDAVSSLKRGKRDISIEESEDQYEDFNRISQAESQSYPINQNKAFIKEDTSQQHPDLLRRHKRSYYTSRAWKPTWRVQLVFLAIGDDQNIFTRERLEKIHQVELLVRQHPNYHDFCFKGSRDPFLQESGGCTAINSLLTYFYPSQKGNVIYYNGLGDTLEDINKTLLFAMNDVKFYWYVDNQINKSNLKSRLLRSELQFAMPIKNFQSRYDRKEEQYRLYKEFVISYIDILSKQSNDKVRVLYGSPVLYDYQVDQTFIHDIKLSIYAGVFIVVFMFVLTSFSLWLTFWGMMSIVCSIPLTLFFYMVVCGNNSLGILNGAAAFLIIGIGVDDVFVFINTFRQADHITNIVDRLLHMLKTAGVATFFTSFTTSAAFAANVASAIPAIHGFGLFMSLTVATCWLTVVLIMPPAIYLWYKVFSKCEFFIYSRLHCQQLGLKNSKWKLPSDIQHFLEAPEHSSDSPEGSPLTHPERTQLVNVHNSQATGSSSSVLLPDKDEDDDLILMNNVTQSEGGYPTFLGMLSQINERMSAEEEDLPLDVAQCQAEAAEDRIITEGCSLTKLLQVILYRYVVCPVVKVKWFILVIYLVVLLISGILVGQLKPASKPPELFDESTNLQQFLNLAYNFSGDNIQCDECSAVFTVGTVDIGTTTSPHPTTFRQTQSGHVTPVPTLNVKTSKSTLRPIWTPPPAPPTVTHTNKPEPVTVPTTATLPVPSSSSTLSTTHKPAPAKTKSTTRAKPTPKPAVTAKYVPPVVTNSPPIITAWHPPGGNPTNGPKPASPGEHYDPCAGGKCSDPKTRPNLETGAAVYVLFGVKGVDRSNVSHDHVLTDKGTVIFDQNFQRNLTFGLTLSEHTRKVMKDLCMLCNLIANNTKLVKPDSSQCIPDVPYKYQQALNIILHNVEECSKLPRNRRYNHRSLPYKAMMGLETLGSLTSIKWVAFAFESTIFKGQGYFQAYNYYQDWDNFIEHLKDTAISKDSPLQDMFQTSEFWKNVMMEVVAVTSAIYGLMLSMIICVAAVAIFTGHAVLLLIIVMTIIGVICLVVALFFIAGWEMGAVEAVSLSILVGSSVDYCVHLVEGYILAGKSPPPKVQQSNKLLREWRTKAAVSHIGVSIVSSAITTIIAAIPLTQTLTKPFSKFGQIVAMNTSVSILYTLTVCAAFLATIGPARFRSSIKATAIVTGCTFVTLGLLVLILYIIHLSGIHIPSPSGQNLFG